MLTFYLRRYTVDSGLRNAERTSKELYKKNPFPIKEKQKKITYSYSIIAHNY